MCYAHLNSNSSRRFACHEQCITSIRDVAKYVKSSQGRKQRFEKMIKEVGISCDKQMLLDVATRWNPTYHMICHLISDDVLSTYKFFAA